MMTTQKELKARLVNILATEVWKGSPDMVDFCVKKTAYIVELTNGDIITIDKPSIKKDFCFGYSDSAYDTDSFDNANRMAHHAKTNVDYFLERNLADINQIIGILNGEYKGYGPRYAPYIVVPYRGQSTDSKLKGVVFFNEYSDEAESMVRLEGEDLDRVIEGYKVVKASFEKRLHTYLKRYGLSKVNTWSYWRDA